MAIRPTTSLANQGSKSSSGAGAAGVFSGRVMAVMLDDQTNAQAFKDFGEWSSIGCIFFDKLNKPNASPSIFIG